jgi:hypothetical protein
MLLLAQMALSSVRKSAAFDEPYHLGAGYAYLRTGDPRLSWEHPPLVDVWAALPLLARRDIALPLEHPSWDAAEGVQFGDEFLWKANFDRAPKMVWEGRWPIMLLAIGLGAVLFIGVREVAGESAAWFALLLLALDPNIIGNGRLITTDLGLTLFFFVAVWCAARYAERPTVTNLIAVGGSVGLAMATKYSAVLLGPCVLLVVVLCGRTGNPLHSLGQRLAPLIAIGFIASVVVWAAYGFEFGPLPGTPVPVPAPTYWKGVHLTYGWISSGVPSFLLGRINQSARWYYFPVVFSLKTPLPTLILAAAALSRIRWHWREWAVWVVPLLVYFAAAMLGNLNLGYRHILPALPFTIALAATSAASWVRHRTGRLLIAILLGWAAVSAVRVFPDHLSYVNEIGGGPSEGHRLFADANVDWGQDLVGLEEYTSANGPLSLSYFGRADPAAYGVAYRPLPGFPRVLSGPAVFGFNHCSPPPGRYAISVTSLRQGLIYNDSDLYRYFRTLAPVDRIGHSILVFEVQYRSDTLLKRSVVVGESLSNVSCHDQGQKNGEQLIAKWVGPGAFVFAGAGPARYMVYAEPPPSQLVAEFLDAGTNTADTTALLRQVPKGEMSTPDGKSLSAPVCFEGGPCLVGYDLPRSELRPGETADLVSYWLVEQRPETGAHVFVHVLNGDGSILAQWDGWPVADSALESGDVVVVHHPVRLPGAAEPGVRVVQIGLYEPPDGPRLVGGGSDRLVLQTVEVGT